MAVRQAPVSVPAQRIGDIIAGRRGITADTDLRLCRFFGLSDGWWLRLQADRDTEIARAGLSKTLARIKPWASSHVDKAAARAKVGWAKPQLKKTQLRKAA